MRVSAQYAQTHLDDLLTATERGEEVEIERPNASPIRLILVNSKPRTKGSLLGAAKGQIWMSDDFKSAADSEEMADLFENGPLD